MTNAELITKIKSEIERRIALYSSLSENTVNPNRIDEDRQILSFISSLESEKPMNGLEEEINRTYHDGSVTDTSDLDHNSYENIASHFAQWGAEHLADARKTSPKDLEEAAEESWQNSPDKGIYDEYSPFYKDGFIAGAKWYAEHAPLPDESDILRVGIREGKRLMMEEAVEGEVYLYHSYNRDATAILVDIPKDKLGDKVRVIVCKKKD